jgi:DNA polymerase-3 subunit gamma/tau
VLSLYRRHRPRTFDEVVGQEHIVRTLRNAVELGKVHHAYLFVGSRGTGKTSMAKLLACALNAEGGPRTDFSPDDPACRAIAAGNSLDVVEMDAASNNSVDDIRELRENVALQPMSGRRRVYILDEAHMLSTAAWNAFLKTLEEPPPHVVFVLATTEAHKVPATIVDRCHRFDFTRASLQQLAGVLRRVAAEEGIEVPDAAIGMIARAAGGSFRDALGTLEQLVTYGGNRIELADVLDVLGAADAELILEAAEALADHDARTALLCIDKLAASGRDVPQFTRDLAAHLRHVFVTQTLGEVPETFSATAEHTDRIRSQADRISEGALLRSIDLLSDALVRVKDGADPRIQLELALSKAVRPDTDPSIDVLALRIEELERRLALPGGAGNETATAPASRPTAGSRPPETAASPVRAPDRSDDHAEPTATGASALNGSPARGAPTSPPAPPPTERTPEADPPTEETTDAGPPVAVAEAPSPGDSPEPAPALDLGALRSLWPAVVDAVRSENAMVAALLGEARPSGLDERRLIVAVPVGAGFTKRKIEAKAALVEAALRRLTGRRLALAFELSDGGAEDRTPQRSHLLTEDELLERLKAEFGAREIFDDEAPTREE